MKLGRLEKSALAIYGLIIVLGCGSYDRGSYGEYSSRPADEAATENDEIRENDFIDVVDEELSTFSVDVDNASYSIARREIQGGALPPHKSVRPEEFINYFDYEYIQPNDYPFSIDMEAAPSPFGEPDAKLLRVGLQGRDVAIQEMRPTRLTFVVDHSGSMINQEEKIQETLRVITRNLRPQDAVSIVVYEGEEMVLLPPTFMNGRERIDTAIEDLGGNFDLGSITNGEAGLEKGYEVAESMFEENGNNRVVLMSDGGFNDGKIDDELIDLISTYRDRHISLTTVGFGGSTYSDYNLEGLAQVANGNYFFIDSKREAERVFEDRLPATVEVIAADVKVQVAFDETAVKRFRLIGYDDRPLPNEDFANDDADAGEIGAGHTVTAFYEVELQPDADDRDVLAEVRMSYKEQYGDASEQFERSIKVANIRPTFEDATDDFRFAAAVAEFAEILRMSKHSEGDRFDDVRRIASGARANGSVYKDELVDLVESARTLW